MPNPRLVTEQFPLLHPLEAALVAFWIHVLGAVEEAGPRTSDIELCPPLGSRPS